jgi:hypothetical protein
MQGMGARCAFAFGIVAAILLSSAPVPSKADAPAPEAPSSSMPALPILGGNHVLYVLAVGLDASTRSKIVVSLTQRLDEFSLKDNAWVFAEPGWSVSDYVNQCTAHPKSTEGAILLNVGASASGSRNDFFYTKNWYELDSDALFVTCDRTTATAKPTYGVAWESGMLSGFHAKKTYEQLFSASALLFAAASTVSTFIPSHSLTTTSVMRFPVPNPLPRKGSVAETTTTAGTTTNPSSLANSTAAFLTPALALTNGNSPAKPILEEMVWNAAEVVVTRMVDRMDCPLKPGRKRTDPKLPDVGTPPPPAPFCAAAPTDR